MARAREQVGTIMENQRGNAIVAWLLLAVIASVALESVFTDDPMWSVFVLGVLGLCALPPLAYRDASVMLPWEVIALAALPIIGHAFSTLPLTNDFTTYLSVAGLALIIAVLLQLFTPVRMSVGFAIALVVVTTMATAGLWAVTRWSADLLLDTQFLLDPALSEAEIERGLMFEFVFSTAAGLIAGVVFEYYFRRQSSIEQRIPHEILDETSDAVADAASSLVGEEGAR